VATTWVALLRGINVGRNKRVAMADLRRVLGSLGYDDVRTLLMSGNAVFTSDVRSAARVESAIEGAITSELGMDVKVLVRNAAEIDRVVRENPFAKDGIPGTQLHAVFLAANPTGKIDVDPAAVAPDEFSLGDRVVYIYVPNGLSGSTLPDFGKELGMTVTARNWNTVLKLQQMAKELA
jgi:uncharacterized protein (DUF1697 family)